MQQLGDLAQMIPRDAPGDDLADPSCQRAGKLQILLAPRDILRDRQIVDLKAPPANEPRILPANPNQPVAPAFGQDRSRLVDAMRIVAKSLLKGRPLANRTVDQIAPLGVFKWIDIGFASIPAVTPAARILCSNPARFIARYRTARTPSSAPPAPALPQTVSPGAAPPSARCPPPLRPERHSSQ